MSHSNVEIVGSLHELFSNKGLEAATALVSDDFEWRIVAFDMTMRGPEGFQQGFGAFAGAFPDSQIRHKNVVGNGDQVVVEYDFTGTHNGPLQTPAGPVAPTGKAVSLPGVEVYRVEGGKITSLRTYFDAATMLRQLGLVA